MNRRFQFSLKTVFVATTAIGLMLGVKSEQARNQREAVDYLLAKGCFVYYRHEELLPPGGMWSGSDPPGPIWLRASLGDDYFRTADMVNLRARFTDNDLPVLARLRTLRYVVGASGSRVTLAGLRRLREKLPNCEFSDLEDSHARSIVDATDYKTNRKEGQRLDPSEQRMRIEALEVRGFDDAAPRLAPNR